MMKKLMILAVAVFATQFAFADILVRGKCENCTKTTVNGVTTMSFNCKGNDGTCYSNSNGTQTINCDCAISYPGGTLLSEEIVAITDGFQVTVSFRDN